MKDLYGRQEKPWDELPPDDHDPEDFTLAELEQVERNIEKMRGGNLAFDNSRQPVKID